jgi:hypothetical protein
MGYLKKLKKFHLKVVQKIETHFPNQLVKLYLTIDKKVYFNFGLATPYFIMHSAHISDKKLNVWAFL